MASNKDDFVKMKVGGLTLDPVTKTPIVVLCNDEHNINLPIWIGLLEATSMATELEGIKMARPMTHDLLKNLIEACGAAVQRIEVTSLKDNTFYALIYVAIGDSSHAIDSRPSDAISLALRTKSPIYVARQVIEASTLGMADENDGARTTGHNLSDVSRDQWNDILENLEPSDFKYKT